MKRGFSRLMFRGAPRLAPRHGRIRWLSSSVSEVEYEVDQKTISRVISSPVPVLLDCHAPWCQPCKKFTPVLQSVVKEAAGAVHLAKLDMDENPELSRSLQIQSLPTVILLNNGKIVDRFSGAVPREKVVELIAKYVPKPDVDMEQLFEEASRIEEMADVVAASKCYKNILQHKEASAHNKARAIAGLVRMALAENSFLAARALLDKLSTEHKEFVDSDAVVKSAFVRVELSEEAQKLPPIEQLEKIVDADPEQHQARFELAFRQIVIGKFDDAIDNLLLIVRKNRNWSNKSAQGLLFRCFDIVGPQTEQVSAARQRLANILY